MESEAEKAQRLQSFISSAVTTILKRGDVDAKIKALLIISVPRIVRVSAEAFHFDYDKAVHHRVMDETLALLEEMIPPLTQLIFEELVIMEEGTAPDGD